MSENNNHAGHRKRLKDRFLREGLDNFEMHNILELLLFFGVPQKDTNELAHNLIDTFGSLTAVFEAEADALFQVKGMTERAVVLIKLMLPLFRRYTADRNANKREFKSIDEISQYLVARHQSYGKEVFMLTSLNEVGNLIACDVISKGDAINVSFEIKDVVQKALKHNATYVVVSHNHLTGNTKPSDTDIKTTQNLAYTLKQMNIKLIDHIIIAGNEYTSMAKNKEILPMI